MSSFFDQFDRVSVVNLSHRQDRRSEMTREFNRLGRFPGKRISFFPAIVKDDAGPFRRKGSHGNFHSHLTLLKAAAAANCSLLILEDDCNFYPHVDSYKIPEDCDIFYGGFSASDPDNPEESEIIGSHFMGFSRRGAKIAAAYLSGLLDGTIPHDPESMKLSSYDPTITPSIDGAYVWMRRAHPELKTCFSMLGYQRRSRSDVAETKIFDRLPVLASVAALSRQWWNSSFHIPAKLALLPLCMFL